MEHDTRYPWFVLDIFVFLAINIFMLLWFRDKFMFPQNITFLQFFIFGLAVYRGADIISNEKITKPLRAPFVKIKVEDGKEIEEPKKNGFKGNIGSLLYCQSCSGVWIAMLLVYAFLLWPNPTKIIIIILALSGFQEFFDSLVLFLKRKPE